MSPEVVISGGPFKLILSFTSKAPLALIPPEAVTIPFRDMGFFVFPIEIGMSASQAKLIVSLM